MRYTFNIAEHIPRLREAARRAKIIIEMGVEFGTGSTAAFQEGFSQNEKGLLWIGVDIDTSKISCLPKDSRFRLVKGDTTQDITVENVRKMLVEEASKRGDNYTTADMIFIDTVHHYEFLKVEMGLWDKLVSKDALWLFHDTYMNGSYNHMTDYIKEYASAHGYSYYDFSTSCNGLGMMFRELMV